MHNTYSKKIVGHLSKLERVQLETLLRSSIEKEQRLGLITNALPGAVIAFDYDNSVVFANEGVYDIIGVKHDNIIDKQVADFIRDPALKDALKDIDPKVFVSLCVNVKYPRRLSLSIQTTPLAGQANVKSENNQIAYLVYIRDISHEQVQSSSKARETRMETTRLLTAGVAHEIGNPLGAIILHTQLMDRIFKKMDDSPEISELKQINHIVNEESTRLKRIVADFLNAVRPLSMKFELADITNTLDEVLHLLHSELHDNSISLVKDFSDLQETMYDPDQMTSVFINVVRNAIDAMPDGGELTVSLRNRGDWIEIIFADTGEGIENNKLERVFDPFYTTKTHGSGLGLLIVQRIINAHNGIIKIDSTPGKGTAIIIELPVRKAPGKKSLPLPQEK